MSSGPVGDGEALLFTFHCFLSPPPAGFEVLSAGCKALPASSEALPAASEALIAASEKKRVGKREVKRLFTFSSIFTDKK